MDEKEVEYEEGGHWNHDQLRLRLICDEVAEDDDAACLWPITCGLFGALGEAMWEALEEMDGGLGKERVSPAEAEEQDRQLATKIFEIARAHLRSEGLETEDGEEGADASD